MRGSYHNVHLTESAILCLKDAEVTPAEGDGSQRCPEQSLKVLVTVEIFESRGAYSLSRQIPVTRSHELGLKDATKDDVTKVIETATQYDGLGTKTG